MIEIDFGFHHVHTTSQEEGSKSIPSSGSEGIDWEELASKIRGGTVGGLGKYALGVFLNNEVYMRFFLLLLRGFCYDWGHRSSVVIVDPHVRWPYNV